jgi:serine/threonine protein kinase
VSSAVDEELLAGRYRLDGLLGTGGMAEVHRAWDTRLHRFVALKLFSSTTDATACQRFDNEIHTLAKLSHPGLVRVYDAGSCDQVSFAAMQLVDGCTLRERISGGPMQPHEMRRLGAHLAEALAHVHENGVVHRDVKPSNILLDAAETPYLADFGLARLSGATRLTRSDEVVGTAAYLAPEQVRGGEIGCPTDIYALGLVLLECLTGKCEYEGNEIESAVARLHRPPAIPEEVPTDLARLLTLMTSLTPRRRPTAAQCARILEGVETVELPTQRPKPVKSMLVAAAVSALGITGVAWATLGGAPPATSAPQNTPATTTTNPTTQPPVQPTVVHYVTTVVTPQQPKTVKPPAKKGKGKSQDKRGDSDD